MLTPGTNLVDLLASTSTPSGGNSELNLRDAVTVHSVHFIVKSDNTGIITVTYAGRTIAEIGVPPATGDLPQFDMVSNQAGTNGIDLKKIQIKGAGAGDDVYVHCYTM